MALINRIGRLFRADFHAVLDQIEEPEQLLKQAVREMEDDLAVREKRIALHEQEERALITHGEQLEVKLLELDEQLSLCIDSEKDDLAKGLVRRKLEAERVRQRMHVRRSELHAFLADSRATVTENQAILEGLRQKAELVTSKESSEVNPVDCDFIWNAADLQVGDDEVEVALLQEISRRRLS